MPLSVEFLNIKVRSISRSNKRINNFNKFNCLKNFFFFINIVLLTVLNNFKKKNLNKNIIINQYFPVKVGKLLNPPKDRNAYIFEKEKKGLLKYLSRCSKRKIEKVESIFLNVTARFGNQLILINKVIFFCEILKCKRIILNKKIYWFIKKKIIDKKYNITIETGVEEEYRNKNVLIDNSLNLFFYFKYLIPKIRPNVIKKEILRNLPKISVNNNDLYIYIRSGDIFQKRQTFYFQPPLCFYQNILYNFTFNNINIISENRNNPVIDNLLIQFPKISFKENPLKYDISYLIYAYNLVGSFSTFINYIIKYNDNLKSFWYFNFYIHNFYAVFFNFEFYHKVKRYSMKESDFYNKMSKCPSLEEQKQLMINYKCPNKIYNIK